MLRCKMLLCLAISSLLFGWTLVWAQNAPKNDVKNAEYYLKLFEQRVEKMRGSPFVLSHNENEAMKRIGALKDKYPKDPAVEALFQRVRAAIMASKGEMFTITPEMIAYKKTEEELSNVIAKASLEEWNALCAEAQKSDRFIAKPFPVPNVDEVADVDVKGKLIVLEGVEYPQNEFVDTGNQYLFAGKPTHGFYYMRLSDYEFQSAYSALKKYKLEINPGLEGSWTMLAEIKELALLVPDPNKEKKLPAYAGWLVNPVAIYVPGKVLVKVEMSDDPTYCGEAEAKRLKEKSFTVTAVPEGADPLKTVAVFATAIKEKNYELYLACIDPEIKSTKTALARMKYYWENNQERYRTQYVYIEPKEVKEITIVQGEKPEASPEARFLSPEELAKIKAYADDLIEEAIVLAIAYDERGKQKGTPRPVHLRRYGGQGRWFLFGGFPL